MEHSDTELPAELPIADAIDMETRKILADTITNGQKKDTERRKAMKVIRANGTTMAAAVVIKKKGRTT